MRPNSDPALSFRAANPSSASLTPAIQNTTKATSRAMSPGNTKARAKTGTSTIRMMVRILGRASMAGTVARPSAKQGVTQRCCAIFDMARELAHEAASLHGHVIPVRAFGEIEIDYSFFARLDRHGPFLIVAVVQLDGRL